MTLYGDSEEREMNFGGVVARSGSDDVVADGVAVTDRWERLVDKSSDDLARSLRKL